MTARERANLNTQSKFTIGRIRLGVSRAYWDVLYRGQFRTIVTTRERGEQELN